MVEIEELVEILMEDPEATATNEEFAEWLKEQDEKQNKEYEWKDELFLKHEGEEGESDGD
jgi:hypothetical protein